MSDHIFTKSKVSKDVPANLRVHNSFLHITTKKATEGDLRKKFPVWRQKGKQGQYPKTAVFQIKRVCALPKCSIQII